ncbi:N-acetylmuramoyl-L-alanine amidase [Shinella sp.]|uniref:N-acetylmuramoyl-L-alanine amidase n=1 Tax=Shinella sp. TaxID=1870904 RepID=UPI0040368353
MPLNVEFSKLVTLYANQAIEFPKLKPVTLAMWILESGRGTSELAKKHKNYAGMKWRAQMEPFATPVDYEAHDGTAKYCKFANQENFIRGFWAFLDRAPYEGWRSRVSDPELFIAFIGPIWAENSSYAEKVINLLEEAETQLGQSGATQHGEMHSSGNFACEACGSGDGAEDQKPPVNRWEPTSHQSSRNNTDIDHIVVHYTTSRNIEGSIQWFKHGNPRTSAHYIVGRDGALVQMVNDSERAWHAGSSAMNARSIGIEHVAAPGDEITPEQEKVSAKLIRWLMQEYEIPKANVIPHVCVKPTSCCGDLFRKYGGRAGGSCDVQKEAVHEWMSAMGL